MTILDDAIAWARQQHPRGGANVLADEVERLRAYEREMDGALVKEALAKDAAEKECERLRKALIRIADDSAIKSRADCIYVACAALVEQEKP